MLSKVVLNPLNFFMLFFSTKIIGAHTSTRIMSNYTGVNSVAYVTVPTNEVAKKIAQGLVKSKLAACVNIIPQVTSIYEWKGEINEDNELLLIIKTRTDTVDDLTKYVKQNHPYEVCEVISFPIQNGNEDYFKWMNDIIPPRDKREEGKEVSS
ncbi:divalent-cation tolerance protein CutA [Prorops nasuta]|uniref:divalent-cation tolerance protein CutA n=1 Tax=Prorops nasuta TaxID=863751 RepID=UPI0034CFE874